MRIERTVQPVPVPRNRLFDAALAEATPHRPSLIVATTDDGPDLLLGARAYRDQRLGELTRSLATLGRAAGRMLFPRHAPLIDALSFVVGSAPQVARMLRGGVSTGDVVDIAKLTAGVAVHARNLAVPVPFRGPDDGTRAAPVRMPTALDRTDAALGFVAKLRGQVVAGQVTPTAFEMRARAEPRPLAEAGKIGGLGNPVVGAGLGLLDVLADPYFWQALEAGQKPVPPRFRNAGSGGA